MKSETVQKLLSLVQKNYEEIAVDFDKTRQKEVWPELKQFSFLAEPDKKILDVGCGNGRLISAFDISSSNYLGVDNSEPLLKIAQSKYPDHQFRLDDILALSQASDISYDSIFCLAVLPHIPSEELRIKALINLKKKLRPGGTIVLSAWNLWSPIWRGRHYRQLILKSWLWSLVGRQGLEFGDILFPWKNAQGTVVSERYYHAFRTGELKKLAQSAGLKVKDLKKDKHNYWLILN